MYVSNDLTSIAYAVFHSNDKRIRIAQAVIVSLAITYAFYRASQYWAGRLIVKGCLNNDPRMVRLLTPFITPHTSNEIATCLASNIEALKIYTTNHYYGSEKAVALVVAQGGVKVFTQLFEAGVVSASAIRGLPNDFLQKMSLSQRLLMIQCAVRSLPPVDSVYDHVLQAFVSDFQQDLFSDEELKEYLPLFFEIMQLTNYYHRLENGSSRGWVHQIFERGVDLRCLDINTPFDREGNRYLHLRIHEEEVTLRSLARLANPSLPGAKRATPFHLAVMHASPKVVKHCIEAGALLQEKDGEGFSPLGRCIASERIEIALILLKTLFIRKELIPYSSPDEFKKLVALLLNHLPKTKNPERDCLIPILKRAVELKAMDVNAPLDSDGNRLLHWALHDQGLLSFLLRMQADPNIKDKDGFTPLQRAIQLRQAEAVVSLYSHGALVPDCPVMALEGIKLLTPGKNARRCLLAFWKKIKWTDLSTENIQTQFPALYSLVFSQEKLFKEEQFI